MKKSNNWLACVAMVGILTSCATPIASRVAPDYSGHPSRVVIVPQYYAALSPRVTQRFLDELARSLEACRITIMKLPPGAEGPILAAALQDADADLVIHSRSYTVGGFPRMVESETFDVEFIDVPTRRIVWRGDFPIGNAGSLAYTPVRTARDLVARLSQDGILKQCPHVTP